MALLFNLILGALEPGANARAYHRALEVGEGPRDLKHQLARRCRGVDRLLI
jgi:hypothetical protein